MMRAVAPSREQAGDVTLDHIGIVGRDIGIMVDKFRRLGFTVTSPAPLMRPGPDGNPIPLGQLSAHVIFAETYLELTAVEKPGAGNHLDPWIERHEGLHIVALRAENAAECWVKMQGRGLAMPPLQSASRIVDSAGVAGTARFKWFQVPLSLSPEGFTCVVEHQTPDLVFIPGMTAHTNGATGLRSVGAMVNDLDDAASRHAQLYGAQPSPAESTGYGILESGRVLALATADMCALYPGATLPAAPSFVSFSIRVKDINVTRDFLNKQGLPFQSAGPLSIWVKPDLACGAVLLFVDERASA